MVACALLHQAKTSLHSRHEFEEGVLRNILAHLRKASEQNVTQMFQQHFESTKTKGCKALKEVECGFRSELG